MTSYVVSPGPGLRLGIGTGLACDRRAACYWAVPRLVEVELVIEVALFEVWQKEDSPAQESLPSLS